MYFIPDKMYLFQMGIDSIIHPAKLNYNDQMG